MIVHVQNTCCTGDAAITQRQLSQALCAAAVLDSLRRRPDASALLGGSEPVACSVERVHFGSRLGIVIEYAFTWGGQPRPARIFGQLPLEPPGEAVGAIRRKLDSRRPAWLPARARPWPVALLPDLGLILRAPGSDERLDGLWLTEAGTARGSHGGAGLASLAAPFEAADLLAHRLGKRAVVKLHAPDGAPGSAILKLYKRGSGHGEQAAAIHRRLAGQGFDRGPVRVPQVRATAASPDCLYMETVEGMTLSERAACDGAVVYEAAGRALARLHAARLPGLAKYGVADELDLLRRWVGFLHGAAPHLAADCAGCLHSLADAFAGSEPFTPRPIHRDFHEKQLIASEDSVTLTDFDTARAGDPAQDMGNFLAHLDLTGLTSGRSMGDAEYAFREGYGSVRERPIISETNVGLHRRATQLRLAFIHACAARHRDLAYRLLEGVSAP